MELKMILTAEETAKALGIGMNKIYELLISGTIPSRRIGRKYLIPRVALENWLAQGDKKEASTSARMCQQSWK